MTAILGIDFTSAPRSRKAITIARGRLAGGAFALEAIDAAPDWAAFERLLAEPGPWIGGFDFPFGLPREAVRDLGWPADWTRLVAHCRVAGTRGFHRRAGRVSQSDAASSRSVRTGAPISPAGSH